MEDQRELDYGEVLRRIGERGWGPYPRTRDEILMRHRAPQPVCDVRTGLWGYAGAVPARYRDAQPFAEEAAWVRRPGAHTWEYVSSALPGALAFLEACLEESLQPAECSAV